MPHQMQSPNFPVPPLNESPSEKEGKWDRKNELACRSLIPQ